MNVGAPTVKSLSHGGRQRSVCRRPCAVHPLHSSWRGGRHVGALERCLYIRSHEGVQGALPMEVRAGSAMNLT